ncbi:type IV pilus biogenesis protein PilM [Desulfallas thermosapovorans]|uniref:Type IV pilus assembly protein PilM n=1 Tax=Desulfallas thermosapovorans DSM 6562 TaxID=1121431 RepID=A0A5S4ZQS3_9FIRM|nr:type IV pilus assembly protein PilM [Desulfallas thermosapovorans]TYO95062.1 type IV pilus assembly protein PilM [Desulfallas thermosapovorans DSM 6562]
MGFFKTSGAVGLELDTGVVRVVALSGDKHAPTLLTAGEIAIPEDAVSEGVVNDVDAVARALEELWGKFRINSRDVVLGISNQGVMMRLANFPKIPDNKLERALRFQAGEYFPIPLEELVFDFSVLGEVEGEHGPQLQILLVAARRDLLDKSLEALQRATLMPRVVDTSALALLRTLPGRRLEEESLLLVDISNGLTMLQLVAGGVPRFARVIPHSLKTYARELDRPLDELLETASQAAAAKQDGGIPNIKLTVTGEPHGTEQWPVRATGEWELALANEIRSSIGYYMSQTGTVVVDGVIVSGRGARVAGLPEFLQAEIEVPVEIVDPLVNIKGSARGKGVDMQYNGPDFAVCIGLALRGLED